MKWNDAMSSSDGSGGMRQALSDPTMLQCNGADPSYLLSCFSHSFNSETLHTEGNPHVVSPFS